MSTTRILNPIHFIQQASIIGEAAPRLRVLCEALEFDAAAIRRARGVLRAMMTPWGEGPIHPLWASAINEQHEVFEFSLAIRGPRPQVRMMIEAQGYQPTVAAQFAAGRRLTAGLAGRPSVCLDRFEAIVDIFASADPRGQFGLWHSVSFANDGGPRYRAYFNPRLDGDDQAWAKVDAAMTRLGLGTMARDPKLGVPGYFALDLHEGDAWGIDLYGAACSAAELLERQPMSPQEYS